GLVDAQGEDGIGADNDLDDYGILSSLAKEGGGPLVHNHNLQCNGEQPGTGTSTDPDIFDVQPHKADAPLNSSNGFDGEHTGEDVDQPIKDPNEESGNDKGNGPLDSTKTSDNIHTDGEKDQPAENITEESGDNDTNGPLNLNNDKEEEEEGLDE
ncbi:hypothetical protein DXG01_001293, partial [Tephrocybe rancida]